MNHTNISSLKAGRFWGCFAQLITKLDEIDQREQELLSLMTTLLKKYSCRCRKCHQLALPNIATVNKYVCSQCKQRMIDLSHRIKEKISAQAIFNHDDDKIMHYYQLACRRIASQYHQS
ncbi:hypothetical protein PT286_05690 [Neisseriaceae bacterium ESL0693]|nr:hypothetical protein [Neisseriaceae bacterium ESL0693]